MPPLSYMPLDIWKAKALEDAAPEDVMLRKSVIDTEIKVMASERQIRITLSTKSVDRDNDTIDPEGWDIRNYEKNPVVLWAHSYSQLPIGNAVQIVRSEGRLSAVDQFVEREVYPFADTVYQLLKGGYLHASSVGFRPIKRAWDEDRRGFDFMTQELLEHSIVPVPANPEALVEARSALGDDVVQPMVEWCEMMLDEWHGEKGLWIPKADIGAAFAALRPPKTVVDLKIKEPEIVQDTLDEKKQRILDELAKRFDLDDDGHLVELVEGDVELSIDDYVASIVGENINTDSLLADVDAELFCELASRALGETLDEALKAQVTAITGRLLD